MLRRAVPLLATSIPRHVWDPARHNPNWGDSYSTEIADRRVWPAKKWSIGLEPRTPEDWRNFSKRNLAYAYNAALRSCNAFPDMIRYYQEMKQRGVKVDLDTMNTLLSRAARFEKIQVPDVFRLFDEMVALGAKPDLASAETLHTVWEHNTNGATAEWREVRRRHLIRIYNALAEADVVQYGNKELMHLLSAQMRRYRDNLRALDASLSPSVYKKYFGCITSYELLVHEVNNFLWEFVSPDHEAKEDPNLKLRIPVLYSVLQRPSNQLEAGGSQEVTSGLSQQRFEDADVCSVLLSAVERLVDHPLGLRTPLHRRQALLSLQSFISTSGVLLTADLVAQQMDIVKFSPLDESRDRDAMRILSSAIRATSVKRTDGIKELWISLGKPFDARVIGRYIAARDPWSVTQFCPQGSTFPLFAASSTATVTQNDPSVSAASASPTDETALTSVPHAASTTQLVRTAAEVSMRWENLQLLIQNSEALTDPQQTANRKVEVFTGLAIFLRHMFTGQRLHEDSGEGPISFSPGLSMEVCARIFTLLQGLRRDVDMFCNEHQVEPELECWESMLAILRGMMDFYVLQKKSQSASGQQDSEEFFVSVAEFRSQLVEESRSRFDGRFRLLWLQEA